MKRFFRIAAACFLALPCLFSGCESERDSDAVLLIDGSAVGRKEFEYHLASAMTDYEYYNGAPIGWSIPISGMTAEEFFLEQAADRVLLNRTVKLKGEEMGLGLTAEELADIEQSVRDSIDQAGGKAAFEEQLEAQGLDRALYAYNLQGPVAYYKIFQSLYGEGGGRTPTESAVLDYFYHAYVRTRHIMIYLTDEEGTPLGAGDEQARRSLMDEVYGHLRAGEDFGALMEEYNEDYTVNGTSLSFSYGEMPEDYYQASISIEPGGFTEVIDIDNALCIINRLTLDDDFLKENYDIIRDEYAADDFNDLLEEWKKDLDIKKMPLYNDINVQAVYAGITELAE